MTKMAELGNFESINGNLAEIKELISEVKNNMMSGEDCNNQFYTIIQTLDNIVTNIDNIGSNNKPSDEYTILQTNILEVRKELSRMNTNIDETICDGLKVLLSKLSEKVNRLEILTNNAGIDQQVVMNSTNQLEKILSQKMKEAYDTLYAQGISSTEAVREDVADINNNLKECVEYLEGSVKAVSADAVQHLSDDMTVLGTTIEKTTDNLKRSVIDLFSRIQDSVSKNDGYNSSGETSKTFDKDIEMLKNGTYNLNANTEQRINQLSQLIEELDVFKKLESFAKLKDLPAIGDLKHSLENNINRIVDEYSYILQTSKNKDKLDNVKYQFRKNIYNEIISMLGNVSEYLIETDYANHSSSIQDVEHSSQLENFSERIEELTSVTELNSSGYDDIQIELKNLKERCNLIFDALKKILKDETIFKINNNLTEIQTQNNFLKEQSAEINELVKECAKNIIETEEPAKKTIKEMLSDIKKNISILQSGDEETDYTYSMQDIESDIAKIRIYLNELSQNGVSINSGEFGDELNNVVLIVDSLKQQLNKISECDLPETLDKMKDDITSISTRVNKLLLTSDNSYNIIDGALKEFKLVSTEIDNQLKSMSDTNKFKNIEIDLSNIKASLVESSNYNNIINQSLIMLAEWVDNAGETLINISEKQKKLENLDDIKTTTTGLKTLISESSSDIISSVETMLNNTDNLIKDIKIIDYKESIKTLGDIIESQNEQLKKQSEHINKLEEKLTTVLEFAAKNDLNELSVKINDIDTKMERLNKSIERLTSYVNED